MLRVLIVGFGDIAQRLARLLQPRAHVYALVRGAEMRARALAAGAKPVSGDLDQLRKLRRIAGIADAVIHLAPPPASTPSAGNGGATHDPRTRRLLAALTRRGSVPRRIVYMSTSGVYGDHAGAWVKETSRLRTQNARAWRRVDAERRVRRWSAGSSRCGRPVRACILRVPGIYAEERLPLQRLRLRQPALRSEDDVYTNHIHADDLARISLVALFRGRSNRVYITSDESQLSMGEYFDRVADAYGLLRPPRITRTEAQRVLPEMALSFMAESRRLSNERMRKELRVRLRYRRVEDFLREIKAGEAGRL